MSIKASFARTGRRGGMIGGSSGPVGPFATVYTRATSRAWNDSALEASGGANAYTDAHAKRGIVVAGRGPTRQASAQIAAFARIKAQNPHAKIFHYVIQTECLAWPEIANSASEAAMLAAGAVVGNVTYRTDTGTYWRCTALPSSTLGNWTNEGATYPVRPDSGTTYRTFEGKSRQAHIGTVPQWALRRTPANGSLWRSDYPGQNDLNHGTSSETLDASGRTLQEYLAQYYYKPGEGLHVESTLGDYIDGIWMDNCKVYPLASADINNTGTEDAFSSPPSATRIAWAKRGHARFINALRAIRPTALVHGNSQFNDPESLCTDFYSDPTLASLDGGMYERAASYNPADQNSYTLHGAGWLAMYNRYKLLTNALTGGNKQVTLTFYAVTSTNYQAARLGICTALLGDGQANVEESTQIIPHDYDEYLADLGSPIESAPTAAISGNIWTRKYQNGIVIVNGATVSDPGPNNWMAGSSENYTPPSGVYRHITATQDTSANPQSGGQGAIVTGTLSIPGWDGRILLCVTPGVHS